MEPPIQTEYFLSGGAMILILMVEGARAVIMYMTASARSTLKAVANNPLTQSPKSVESGGNSGSSLITSGRPSMDNSNTTGQRKSKLSTEQIHTNALVTKESMVGT